MRLGRICTLEFTRTAVQEGYRQPIPFQKLDSDCSDPKHSEIENIFNKSTLQPEKKSNTLLPSAALRSVAEDTFVSLFENQNADGSLQSLLQYNICPSGVQATSKFSPVEV